MSRRGRFYRWALAAPLFGPLVGLALVPLVESVPLLGLLGLFLVGSALYAWTSYLVLAIAVLVWARGRDDAEVARAGSVLPVIYAPIAGVQEAFTYQRDLMSGLWWVDVLTGAALALAFGYAYVGLVRLSEPRLAVTSRRLDG